jgi:hypothetical protein
MNRILVLVYRNSADTKPLAVVGSWGSEREARAWIAKTQVLYPELGHMEITQMFGVRDVSKVVELATEEPAPTS